MRLTLVAALLAVAGCKSVVVGDWQSDTELANGRRNELSVSSDGSAEATIFATPDNAHDTWVGFAFEAEWEQDGDEFDFLMECDQGPCDGNDFKMECQVIKEEEDGDEKLDCNGAAKWTNYPFDWERDSP
jgi:hypothetical protein